MDEAIKHLGEAFAAVFFEVDVGGDLGDGSDGAEVGVQDELID